MRKYKAEEMAFTQERCVFVSCDACGKEASRQGLYPQWNIDGQMVAGGAFILHHSSGIRKQAQYDICPDCAEKLVAAINDKTLSL